VLRSIQDYNHITNPENKPPATPLNPSSISNINQKILAVKPLCCVNDDIMSEACGVCAEDFAAEDLVLTTHCKHNFHMNCIFTWWDRLGCVMYTCPMCRGSISIQTDRMGLTPDNYGPTLHDPVNEAGTRLKEEINVTEENNLHPFWLKVNHIEQLASQWEHDHAGMVDEKVPYELMQGRLIMTRLRWDKHRRQAYINNGQSLDAMVHRTY